MSAASCRSVFAIGLLLAVTVASGIADEPSKAPKAFLDGTAPGWKALGEPDFTAVNCEPKTWTW